MRRSLVALAFCVCLPSLAAAGRPPAPAPPPPVEPAEPAHAAVLSPDTPVLRVFGRDVAKIWYDRALQETAAQLEMTGGGHGAGNQEVRRIALERLIEKEIVYSLALRHDIPDLDAEVERRFQGFIERVGGPEAFAAGLASQGMEERHIRYILRRELASAWYLDKVVGADITVSEEEAVSYYDTYKDRDYLFPEKRKIYQVLAAESRGEDSARERLAEVQQRFRGGEGFGPLALEFSDDPLSRLSDGFMGVRRADELPAEVATACFSAAVGEVTEIVHSPFGWHVFLVTDVVPPRSVGFDEVRDEVRQRALDVKRRKALEKIVKRAGKEAEVEVLMHP